MRVVSLYKLMVVLASFIIGWVTAPTYSTFRWYISALTAGGAVMWPSTFYADKWFVAVCF